MISLMQQDYGTLVAIDREHTHRFNHCAFPRAEITFEAQALLMQVLRNIVDILIEKAEKPPKSANWLKKVQAISEARHELWSKPGSRMFGPPIIDLKHLLGLAQGQLALSKDHRWLLQTDVQYFKHYVKSGLESCHMRIPEVVQSGGYKETAVPYNMWQIPLTKTQFWQWCVDEFEHVCSLLEGQLQEIIPNDMQNALEALESVLCLQFGGQRELIKLSVERSVTFQDWFQVSNEKGLRFDLVEGNDNPQFIYKKDPLFWCIYLLSTHAQDAFETADPDYLFHYLNDQLRNTENAERSSLDNTILDGLSFFAVTAQLLAAVRHLRPEEEQAKWIPTRPEFDRSFWRFEKTLDDKQRFPEEAERELEISFQKFDKATYPTGPRNADWVRKFDAIHRESARYWQATRNLKRHSFGNPPNPALTREDRDSVIKLLSFDMEEDHLKSVARKRNAILSRIQARRIQPAALHQYQQPN
jgi:hypothetical protein